MCRICKLENFLKILSNMKLQLVQFANIQEKMKQNYYMTNNLHSLKVDYSVNNPQ